MLQNESERKVELQFHLSEHINQVDSLNHKIQQLVPSLRIVKLPSKRDVDGAISIIEFSETLDFQVERLFYIQSVPLNLVRGMHAHKECIQVLIAIKGVCDLEIQGLNSQLTITMDTSEIGVIIPNLTWASQKYMEEDTVLLVLASHPYAEDDYIHDFKKYLESLNGNPNAT